MTLTDVVDIAVSGLLAQRSRLSTAASNLANAQTTRTPEGGPYRRRDPVFGTESLTSGFGSNLDRALRKVSVERVSVDDRAPIPRFQPSHPDADAEGVVYFPRINPVEEMTNMMSAQRSFQMNLFSIRKARQMAEAVSRIGG